MVNFTSGHLQVVNFILCMFSGKRECKITRNETKKLKLDVK